MDFKILLLEEIQTIANTVSESCDRLRTALVDEVEGIEEVPEEIPEEEQNENEENIEQQMVDAKEHEDIEELEYDRQENMFGARPGPPPTSLPSNDSGDEGARVRPEGTPFSYKSDSVAYDDDEVYKGNSQEQQAQEPQKPKRGTAIEMVRSKLKELLSVNPKGMYRKTMIKALEDSGIRVSQPTVINSLTLMGEDGEVSSEKHGREVYYRPVAN